ncbi:MAG TPA: NAD(P)-dependent oxidoreductase [Usitatibacter sp.]|nr:NAD(P)-dependent oxidoreductase [Usitatibacter sp.]
MKILLTGASGFIGSRVVRQLQARGHEVAALVEPGDPLRRLAGIEALRRIEGGLESIAVAREAILAFAPEGCIHLAWYAEPGKYLHSERNLGCLAGSLQLLALLQEAGCKRIVGAGTCAEYAFGDELLREDGATKPETLYAACKLSLGMIGQQLAALGDYAFAWGRVFYLYGPGEDPRRAIPALAGTLLAGRDFDASAGTQVRDYVHVDDVASGFVTLVERATTGVYNISSAQRRTMREIMAKVQEAVGSGGRINFGAMPPRGWEPPFICGDNSRLRSLGWEPRIPLEQGLGAVVETLRSHAST